MIIKLVEMQNKDNRLDLLRGSLISGAAGDALGYAVEFEQHVPIVQTCLHNWKKVVHSV